MPPPGRRSWDEGVRMGGDVCGVHADQVGCCVC